VRQARRHSTGFALVYVLTVVAAVSAIALTCVAMSLDQRVSARHDEERAHVDAALDGAIRRKLLELAFPSAALRSENPWAPSQYSILGASVLVTASSESARTDLLRAPRGVIETTLRTQGLLADEASEAADELEHYRRGDRPRSPSEPSSDRGGADEFDARAIGPWINVEQVRSLPRWSAMTASTLDGFTIFGGMESVPAQTPAPVAATATYEMLSGSVARVIACLGEQSACRCAIVRLTGDPRRPFQTLESRVWIPPASGNGVPQ
jgi:hypothetical protein